MTAFEEAELDRSQAQAEVARAATRKYRAETERLERENREQRSGAYEARAYTFAEVVTPESVSECIDTLSEWARIEKSREITIIFNSPGGSVFDGLGLYDYIRYLNDAGTTVNTLGLGRVFSMGSILLQAGATRRMSPHSYLMIHEVSTLAIGRSSDITDEAKLLERLQVRMLDILATRSTLSTRQIKTRWLRKDWWLDAEEALKAGFIDEISR